MIEDSTPSSPPGAVAGPSLPTAVGRYVVRDVLGIGAFATVLLAHDPHLDVDVAVKVLGDPAVHDPELRARFIEEGRVLRRVDDARVVGVRDLGESDGRPFLVLDLHESGTLAGRIASLTTGTEVGVDELRHLVAELAAAMRSIHDAGLVHRDLKPANLLVDGTPGDTRLLGADERLVVADFGLARRLDATGLTVGGGTVEYMSPEQRTPSSTVDRRADLFAASRIVADVVDRFAPAGVARRLAGVLARGMAELPEQRPANADMWERELLDALDVRNAEARTGAVPDTDRPKRRRVIVLATLAVIVVAVGVILAVVRVDDGGSGVGDGPQIIGPDELLLGDPGSWTHENRVGVEYEWTLPDGRRATELVVEYTPTEPAEFRIELVERDQGVERRSVLTVRVRTR